MLAINKRTALKMFWDGGFDSEAGLIKADTALATLTQPSAGYYCADDVSTLIERMNNHG